MGLGLGELLLVGALALFLLEPQDIPRAARKAAGLFREVRKFMRRNWLVLEDLEDLADPAGREQGRK